MQAKLQQFLSSLVKAMACCLFDPNNQNIQGSHTLAQIFSLIIPWDFPDILSNFPALQQ